MKIAKVKTSCKKMGLPVNTELEAVVERMRLKSTREAVARIAEYAHLQRLLDDGKEQMGHFDGLDALPRLLFGATFGKKGFDDVREMTGLLLMDVDCTGHENEMESMRQRLADVPYTVMVFRGSSMTTLKVVVRTGYADGRGPKDKDDYLRLLRNAQQIAAPLYEQLTGCTLRMREVDLTTGCRMSYDPKVFFRPEAKTLPVSNAAADVLAPYRQGRVDEDGTVAWYPDRDEREQLNLAFYSCMRKAREAWGTDDEAERLVVMLADNCRKAGLAEEACVRRALWESDVKVSEDVVRKIFRSTYAKRTKGKPASPMNEKERIARTIRDFFTRRYELRFNEVKQQVEFRRNDQTFQPWQLLTERELKRMAFEEMMEGGCAWSIDTELYVRSAMVRSYHPIREFLGGLGRWDGKCDYIEAYARRLPTDFERWPQLFHRWFLAMVAQALDMNRDHGNSVVPLIIGRQGVGKSTFCKNILPYSMRDYYMDDIKMDNAEQVERVLGCMWLVNIDEYNAKTEREVAKIKRLLTEKDVQVRRMRSDHYKSTARLCSFIATTNDQHPLTDPTGSRRYMCVEANGPIDMSGVVAYQQMYAQAVDELENGERYWFTSDEEREIEAQNRQFQQTSTVEETICTFFAGADKQKEWFMTSTSIQQVLRKHLSAADVPTLKRIGMAMKQLRMPEGQCNNVHGYYLRIKN